MCAFGRYKCSRFLCIEKTLSLRCNCFLCDSQGIFTYIDPWVRKSSTHHRLEFLQSCQDLGSTYTKLCLHSWILGQCTCTASPNPKVDVAPKKGSLTSLAGESLGEAIGGGSSSAGRAASRGWACENPAAGGDGEAWLRRDPGLNGVSMKWLWFGLGPPTNEFVLHNLLFQKSINFPPSTGF